MLMGYAWAYDIILNPYPANIYNTLSACCVRLGMHPFVHMNPDHAAPKGAAWFSGPKSSQNTLPG